MRAFARKMRVVGFGVDRAQLREMMR
jgi:hypothetical protein